MKVYVNTHFITDKETGEAELDNPLVLIVEIETISNLEKDTRCFRIYYKEKRPLLIIADVDPQVM